jgi:hypothetical protein
MKLKTRQKAGIGLIALSVVAHVIIMNSYRSSEKVEGTVITVTVQETMDVHYLIPLLLCGPVGLLCLVWPSRNSTTKPR